MASSLANPNGPFAMALAQTIASVEAQLTPLIQQTVLAAVSQFTNDTASATYVSSFAATQFTSNFVPLFVTKSTDDTIATFQTQSRGVAMLAIGLITNIVGLVLWVGAYVDKRKPKALWMITATTSGILNGALGYTLITKPYLQSFAMVMGYSTVIAVHICTLLVSSAMGATVFWSNKTHARWFHRFIVVFYVTLMTLFMIFVGLDVPGCNYQPCTPRTKYFLIFVPPSYVLIYFGLWVRAIWVAQRKSMGDNKQSIKRIAQWSTVCGVLSCILYLILDIRPDDFIIYIGLYGFISWLEFLGDYGARLQRAIGKSTVVTSTPTSRHTIPSMRQRTEFNEANGKQGMSEIRSRALSAAAGKKADNVRSVPIVDSKTLIADGDGNLLDSTQ